MAEKPKISASAGVYCPLTANLSSAVNGFTFLVCTHNGALRLPETLRHLAAQQASGLPWEVLLISNASTDATAVVAPRLWANLGAPAPLRVLEEPIPGKENALIRGFDEATYECISIVDDDNWLFPDYLLHASQIMVEHPQIGILGARAEAAFEIPPPEWFTQFEAVYAVGPQASQPGPLTAAGAYLYGAGSVVRRSAWQHLRANDFAFTTSTKRGKVIVSGEDVELGDAFRLAGYQLWYDDRLRLRHFMYKERLTWEYLLRIGRGTASSGLTSLVYYFLQQEPNLLLPTFRRRYLRWLAWLTREVLRQPGKLLTYQKHIHDSNYPASFETLRQLYRLRMGLTRRAEAERIFLQVKSLQARLQVTKAPITNA
jgi:glycosyltransferase involved in cell wall biosynthesis